jgi:hypothetical protein
MVDGKILKRVITAGAICQLGMVVAGHFFPWLRPHLFLFGSMMISGVVGLLYARDLAKGYGAGALGGAAGGCLCGIIAVASSALLGDQPDLYIPFGVIVCTLTGAIGGLFGQWDAKLRALSRPQ